MKNFLPRNLDTNFIFLIHSDIKILLSILEKEVSFITSDNEKF